MKERAAELIFRHKLLILLPVMVIMPLVLMAATQPQPPRWQSFVVVWVDQYKFLYQDDRLGYTPAANQASLLNDFLRTRSFAADAVGRTQLAAHMTSPQAELQAVERLRQSVVAYPNSNNFITIVVTMSDPDLAYEVATAVVDTFRERLGERLHEQNQAALKLTSDALAKTEQDLAKARSDLAAYVAAKPEVASARADNGFPIEARDPSYARLFAQVQSQQQQYLDLHRRVEDLQASGAAGAAGQELAFSVVDEPQQPFAPIPHSRIAQLKLPVIGLFMALMLSCALALLFILTNGAVLSARDIDREIALPVLGEIPELRRRRWFWQRTARDAVRQRLGQAAQSNPSGVHQFA